MAIVRSRRRSSFVGDYNSDIDNAAAGATEIADLPNRDVAPFAAYKWMGNIYVNLPVEDPDSPGQYMRGVNWVQYAPTWRKATEDQKDAFLVAQGGGDVVSTPAMTASRGADGKIDPAVEAAEVARLAALAQSDAFVRAQVDALHAGTQNNAAAANEAAARERARQEQIRRDANAALQSMLNAGGVFTDTLQPGATYSEDFLRGMISTQEWIEDYISVANGGRPTNADRMRGKLPVGAPVTKPASVPAVSSPSGYTDTTGPSMTSPGGNFIESNPGSSGFSPSGGRGGGGPLDMGGGAMPDSGLHMPGGLSMPVVLGGLAVVGLFLASRKKR